MACGRVKPWGRSALLLALALVLIAAAWLVFAGDKEVQYNGKSVSEWFYTRRGLAEAGDAFRGLGTNAFPFLFSNLKRRGNSALYFKLYRAMPGMIQAQLRYPISGDDIQMASLSHLYKMPNVPNPIPEEWLARLAKQVPELRNPRVRSSGLHTLYQLTRYEREPLVSLCKQLLDDPHFGIRLEASLYLADLGIKEMRTIPILLAALEDKEKLVSSRSISWYTFGQPPGGSGVPLPSTAGESRANSNWADQARVRILKALEFLDAPLNQQQKRPVQQSKLANERP